MSPYGFYFFKKRITMRVFMYLILSFLALSFFSCKDEDPIDDVDPNRISFFVGDKSYPNPKGTILTNANFFKFNVFAYYSTTPMSPTTLMIPFINNLVVAKSLNTWNYVGDYYWPDTNILRHEESYLDGQLSGPMRHYYNNGKVQWEKFHKKTKTSGNKSRKFLLWSS